MKSECQYLEVSAPRHEPLVWIIKGKLNKSEGDIQPDSYLARLQKQIWPEPATRAILLGECPFAQTRRGRHRVRNCSTFCQAPSAEAPDVHRRVLHPSGRCLPMHLCEVTSPADL